jgi:beta-glucosidase
MQEMTMKTTKPLCKALGSALLLLTASSVLNAAAAEDSIIFDGDSTPPLQLFVGSESNWSVPVWGEETTTHKSEVLVVRLKEEDQKTIMQAEWNGGLGQVYWQQPLAVDMTPQMEDGLALSIVARIDQKPKKSVNLKMDCGYPCGGALNMTKLFKAVPTDQWFRMSFKLSCFEDAGANMANIFSPLVITTKDKFQISVSEVSLLENPPPESLVDCG